MTLLDSICCTCAISSLRTAGSCRRCGWRSGGPWVSIACSNSGVFPRSSSPWLKTSLNSLNNSFSCCCWSGERHSGSGGWYGFEGCEEAEAEAGGLCEGDHFEDAYVLPCMKLERLWPVIMHDKSELWTTRECWNAGHKGRESIIGAK